MKRVVFIICLMCAFIFGACLPAEAKAEQTYPIKIWKHNENGDYQTLNVIDEETGVNYIVVGMKRNGSSAYGGVAITPRLNADGGLYVTD